MSIEIKPHPYKIVCDICSSRDTFMVSKTGVPASQCPTLCRNDLKEIVLASMEYFKDEITLPAPDDYEQMKMENERLKVELEAAKAEINRLSIELEAGTVEINRLTVELESMKKKPTPANKQTPNRGGKKK